MCRKLRTAVGTRKAEYAEVFTELEAVAKVQSVKSSNAIDNMFNATYNYEKTRIEGNV